MATRGIAVEVLGVPNILPADRIVDKLTIYFLRGRHGGGEVQRVLYPSYRPGQALVIFEEPEIAARVLQHGSHQSHVMEVDNRQFPLTVKPVDMPEVDIPVEATLDISIFPEETEVMQLLTLHGFEATRTSREQVRVKGTFMMLTAVKARLEKLLSSQSHSQNTTSPASLNGHNRSTGATYKAHTEDNLMYAAGTGSRGTFISPALPMYPTNSSPLEHQADQSSIQNHPRARSEAFVTDEDVLRYAQSFKTKDIAFILNNHNIKMDLSPMGPGLINVILSGSSANVARGELQKLLDDLTKSLRTQHICLSDHDSVTRANLIKQIKVYKAIYPMVVISQTGDTINLVGPSRDAYEVTQRLLGKPAVQFPPVRAGRTLDRGRGSKGRSSSLSKVKPSARDAPDAQGYYHPSKYQDDGAVAAEPDPSLRSSRLRSARSSSESREKVREERAGADHSDNKANQADPSATKKVKAFLNKFSAKDINQRIKKMNWK